MKYFARIDNNEYEVEIDDKTVLLDGKPVNVDLVRSGATVRAAASVSGLNGIDFLEVADAPGAGGEQRLLRIAFVVTPSAQLKLDVAAGEAVVEVRPAVLRA